MRIESIDVIGYDTVLLDRDGTINVHILGNYVCKWKDFEFIPNVVKTIARWSHEVKNIFIVTNQRGIAKGKYSEKDLAEIHSHMVAEIEKAGGRIDGIYYCPSLTEADIRRKPGRGMFDDILRQHPYVAKGRILMIGDSNVDRDFAKNCGIDFIRVDSLKRDGNTKFWVHSDI